LYLLQVSLLLLYLRAHIADNQFKLFKTLLYFLNVPLSPLELTNAIRKHIRIMQFIFALLYPRKAIFDERGSLIVG
jgi:hypothetical protein